MAPVEERLRGGGWDSLVGTSLSWVGVRIEEQVEE